MKIIGICGTSGSGKSTVGKIFIQFGGVVLDCDAIYHELVSSAGECLDEIKREFGEDVVSNNALDRTKLRQIVFADDIKLNKLNQISHYFVKKELKRLISEAKNKNVPFAVIDAPMLFEAELETWCDFICAVVSDEKRQIERICMRDGISPNDAKIRLSKQISSADLEKKCDYVIRNVSDFDHLKKSCKEILAENNLIWQ